MSFAVIAVCEQHVLKLPHSTTAHRTAMWLSICWVPDRLAFKRGCMVDLRGVIEEAGLANLTRHSSQQPKHRSLLVLHSSTAGLGARGVQAASARGQTEAQQHTLNLLNFTIALAARIRQKALVAG